MCTCTPGRTCSAASMRLSAGTRSGHLTRNCKLCSVNAGRFLPFHPWTLCMAGLVVCGRCRLNTRSAASRSKNCPHWYLNSSSFSLLGPKHTQILFSARCCPFPWERAVCSSQYRHQNASNSIHRWESVCWGSHWCFFWTHFSNGWLFSMCFLDWRFEEEWWLKSSVAQWPSRLKFYSFSCPWYVFTVWDRTLAAWWQSSYRQIQRPKWASTS